MTETLRMPSSYVLMDEQEMTYVDGGSRESADFEFLKSCIEAVIAGWAVKSAISALAAKEILVTSLAFVGPTVTCVLAVALCGYTIWKFSGKGTGVPVTPKAFGASGY